NNTENGLLKVETHNLNAPALRQYQEIFVSFRSLNITL
ncbi:MAG: hypothetical protein ACJAX8_000663, partial [Flavobacteriales bacterium]